MTLTLAGVAFALLLGGLGVRHWLKGKRRAKDTVPYLAVIVLGLLATICRGGLLGWLATFTASGTSHVGDGAVHAVSGTSGVTVAHASMGHLDGGGGVVVFILAAAVAVVIKASGKEEKRRLLGMLACAAILGFMPLVANACSDLPQTVNSIGDGGINSAKAYL